MPIILPRFTDQNGTRQHPRARVMVEGYSTAAIGGPKAATLTLDADNEADLWQALDMLAWSVDLYTAAGEWRWGGYVQAAQVTVGGDTYGVSLARIANRLQVTYTERSLDSSGQEQQSQAFTLWASDSESIAAFGTHESRLSFGDSTESAAESYRDSLLRMSSIPIPTVELATSPGKATATLECKGFWETTNRRYYASDSLTGGDLEATPRETVSLVPEPFPQAVRRGQRLAAPAGTAIAAASFVVQKVGTPTGNLRCEIWYGGATAGTENLPATLITFADLDLATLPTSDPPADPVVATWNFPNVLISPTLTTFVVLSLAGGVFSSSNYIAMPVSPAGGPGEGVRGFDDGTWGPNYVSGYGVTPLNALYSVVLTRQTTELIASRITSHAPLLTGTMIEQASGVYASTFEDGQARLQDTLIDLLNMGSATAARLLARVNQDRLLLISPEPLRTDEPTYARTRDSVLQTLYGQPVANDLCPSGVWVQLRAVPPTTAYGSRLADASRVFIEEAEYDPQSDTLTLHPRGVPNVWKVGG